MYFYIDGMFTRAEDSRNRTMSDTPSTMKLLGKKVSVCNGQTPFANSLLDFMTSELQHQG